MEYTPGWVEKHLGISIKAIRGYEEKELIPKHVGMKPRTFSDEDINRLWIIKTLQGVGFSRDKIKELVSSDSYNLDEALSVLIHELEHDIRVKELNLGHVKKIKLTGRIPVPETIGSMTYQKYQENAFNGWNINNDTDDSMQHDLYDLISSLSSLSELNISDESKASILSEKLKRVISEYVSEAKYTLYIDDLKKRKELGPDHPEVQLLIKLFYEASLESEPQPRDLQHFARNAAAPFIWGDISELYAADLGKETCEFIANAIAIFAGYKNFSEII